MAKEAQATPPEKYLRNERGWLWGKPNALPLPQTVERLFLESFASGSNGAEFPRPNCDNYSLCLCVKRMK